MTLSNFDWTDKTSMKWFIMLPTGHEGPYSLEALLKKNGSLEVKVWAEGLLNPVTLKEALANSEASFEEDDEIPPPLPPLPDSGEAYPQFEKDADETVEVPAGVVKSSNLPKVAGLVVGVLLLTIFGLREWVKTQEQFTIRRADKMSPDLFQKISSDFKFDGWSKKIFFKEYTPADMSHIWLVTSGYQHCDVEAQFNSLPGKLLAVQDEKISFKTSSRLEKHIAEFSKFDFIAGNKIVPGLYEMDLKATNCSWGGLAAKLSHLFTSPDEDYVTRMKVVLYHKGSDEFNQILDALIRKKMDSELKNQNQEEVFWQDLQQKLQTLLAISLRIEQLLLEFSESPLKQFEPNLKLTVMKYTTNYGRFLTDFVVANETYFKELEKSELSGMSKKRPYQSLIRMTSKEIGLESMKIIEELQQMKNPKSKDLATVRSKVQKRFELLKDSINRKIIQLTEDRAN